MKQEISEQLKYRNGDHICAGDLAQINFNGYNSVVAMVSHKSCNSVLYYTGLSEEWRRKGIEKSIKENKVPRTEYVYGSRLARRVVKITKDQLTNEERECYDKLIKYLDNESSTNNT